VQTAAVARGDLLVRVLCDGRLEPPEGGELRTADGGTVAELPVHEGDRVNRGQVLLRLANPDLAARARDASGEVRQLQADSAAASADLDHQRHEAAYREQQVAGDRRLLAQGAIPRATLEADQLAWQQAQDQARAAEARLASLRNANAASGGSGGGGSGAGTVGTTGARLALATGAAADLERRVAALTVRAPAAGMVYALPHAVGETAAPGALVASVTDPDHPHVRCRVDQPDLPRVAPGQRLIVTFNGLPDRQWDGAVRRVGTGLREAGGREVAEIVGELADPVHTLPANAAVDVQLVVAQKSGVLSIPRSALRRDSDREGGLPSGGAAGGAAPGRFVYVVSHRHVHRRDIEVGLIGLSQVEVVRGLQEGERVVVEGPPSLSEDARVSETKPH
jgi:RND family efflux transporter MFP subunit